ncbi:MAG TPA: alkaline phosphatase family protein [Candidatus Acidoferrales bacterium]|nr:alkaline phosphatase family protein [Candidatus Acidoferrales bacterium]
MLAVFTLIDALGWRYLEDRRFLNDLLPYRKPLRTVLGFSSGAIPTILTGVPPAQNGHWNLFYYDPQNSPFRWVRYFRILPARVLDNRISRKLMKELGRHVLGMGPLFECCVAPPLLPYFNWVEKRNIYDRGGISGAPSIFDQLADRGVPYRVYSYHHATDTEILKQAERDIRKRAASFFFIYLSEMDMFLHLHCTSPQQVEQRLQWYAANLRKVIEAAREADPDFTFTVLSDHGMTPVQHHYDLVRDVDNLGFEMPKDYLAIFDSTMARFWFFSAQARFQITQLLGSRTCGRILPNEELQRMGVFFSDQRYGETIFLLDPGWLLAESDFNGNGWNPVGMHGYHPADAYSDGIFLSNREPAVAVNTVADVHPCMLRAAGLQGI